MCRSFLGVFMAACPACECLATPRAPPPPIEPPALPIREAFGAFGDDAEVLASITVNMPAVGTAVGLFVVLHVLFHKLYYSNSVRGLEVDAPSDKRLGWCSSVATALRMPASEFIQKCGVDAMAFCEFAKLLLKILFSFMLWACTIEIAIFYSAVQSRDDVDSISPSFLARASLANVDAVPSGGGDSWKPTQALSLIFSMVGLWLNSLYALILIDKSWRRIVGWCHVALEDSSDIVSHALLVRATNPLAKPFSQASALHTWEGLYPGEIFSVRMVRDTGKLPKLLAKVDKLLAKLARLDQREQSLKDAKGKDARTAFAKKTCFGLGPSLDAKRAKLEAQLAQQRLKVADAKHQFCTHANDRGLAYFVLFKASRVCTIASQVVALPGASFEVSVAPVPTGVRWNALKPLAIRARIPTRIAAKAGYWAMLFFYLPIIGFISSLLNVDELYKLFPVVRAVLQALGPQVETFIFALMPTIVFKIFLALLPAICHFFASLHGFSSAGQVAATAYTNLYTFNLITVFLGVSIASSLLSSVYVIINDPPKIISMLASGLATTSTFFITFLMLQFVLLVNKELVRLVPTLTLFAKRRAKLVGDDEAPDEPVKFPVIWVNLMLAMTIGTCYANIAPLTTVFAFGYILVGYVLYRRNLLYCYTHKGESRGQFFPRGVSTLCLVLGIAQLLLAAVHASKSSWITFGFIVPLIYVTYRANSYFQALYTPQMSTLPLAAVDEASTGLFRAATMVALRVAPNEKTSSAGGGMTVKTRKSVTHSPDKLEQLVGSNYIQPELTHPEVATSEHVAELIRRSSSVHVGKSGQLDLSLVSEGVDDMSDELLPSKRQLKHRNAKVAPHSPLSTDVPPATAWGGGDEEAASQKK